MALVLTMTRAQLLVLLLPFLWLQQEQSTAVFSWSIISPNSVVTGRRTTTAATATGQLLSSSSDQRGGVRPPPRRLQFLVPPFSFSSSPRRHHHLRLSLKSSSDQTAADVVANDQEEGEQQKTTTQKQPTLRELYPPSEAYENGTLQVDSLHSIYYQVHGKKNKSNSDNNKKKKKAALFLHGGPGAGCNPTHARFFCPDLYDTIVLLDQRGSGRSTPRAQVYNNTCMHLIQDCETLRRHLLLNDDDIDTDTDTPWHVVLGGSWGTTLALAYAQEYPTSIQNLILRGVCLLRPAEIDWLFTPQGGAAQKNPEAWQSFVETVGLLVPEQPGPQGDADVSTDMSRPDRTAMHRYYDEMFGNNSTRRWNAARGWMTWEFTVSASFKRQAVAKASNSSAADSNQTAANNDIPKSPAVLVSSSGSSNWDYQDTMGSALSEEDRTLLELKDPAETVGAECRQGLPSTSSSSSTTPALAPIAFATPRPFAMTSDDLVAAQEEGMGNFSGLPALAMLTCFYSVNENYVMSKTNLLSSERIARIRDIPCIAVQGGKDPICPPDTALDLNEQWPEMELRIPISAGHSMYHPEIVHELVQATDRIGTVN